MRVQRVVVLAAGVLFAVLGLGGAPLLVAQQAAYVGFDANEYPGDALLPALHAQFAFTGYWLNNPPGATHNPWAGKRELLARSGFGFVVVWNGRLDKEILRAKRQGTPAAMLAKEDSAAAVAAAQRERFPAGTILFLDQEEGGALLPEQAEYLLGWTEGVARSAYKPGVYASGKPVPNGNGADGKPATITTIQDIRARVAAGHLHEVAFWVAQDACPPAPGCVMPAPPVDMSGTPNATAWQYAQSPRERPITAACAKTYARDGNCYAPGAGLGKYQIDLSAAFSADPSHGR